MPRVKKSEVEVAAKTPKKVAVAAVDPRCIGYELTIVVSPTVKAEKRKDVLSALEALLKKHQGRVDSMLEWGLKDLAYPISGQRSGWYVCLTLTLLPDFVGKIDEAVRLDDRILRHLIVRGS